MRELDIGQVIGSYRVVRCIGRGGMGAVYEVEHVELGVRYALKTFTYDPQADTGDVLKGKFLEEAKMLARMQNPGLVHVIDLGFDAATHTPFFVMELVLYNDGEPHSLADMRNYSEQQVFDWFKDVCLALDYVHAQGVVHRDIKPANLLVRGDKKLVLTDFGVSRIFAAQMREQMATGRLIESGCDDEFVLGTPHYIAPEVEAGGEVTMESDAYSVGAMFIYLLTGLYYDEHPEALSMLPSGQYRWSAVLPLLIAPRPERRPKNLSELVHRLLPTDAPPDHAPLAVSHGKKPKVRKPGSIRQPILVEEKRRFDWTRLAFALAFFAAAAFGGYYFWQQGKEKQRLREETIAAQNRAAEISTNAVLSVVQTNTIVKTIYRTNSVEKAREVVKDEKPVEIPKPESNGDSKPKQQEKRIFNVVLPGVERDAVTYGSVAKRHYRWWRDDRTNQPPQAVSFELQRSKTTFELMPFSPGVFFMRNEWKSGPGFHRVTLTYPFWMARDLVTAAQWREYQVDDCEDAIPIEKALAAASCSYPVCVRCNRSQIDGFCRFLTAKYKSQLPDGYVFRLPTLAEIARVADGDGALRKYNCPGEMGWGSFVSTDGEAARSALQKLIARCSLCTFGNWNRWAELDAMGGRFKIGSLCNPFPCGVYDLRYGPEMAFDLVNSPGRLTFGEAETDPLKWVEETDVNKVKDVRFCVMFPFRGWGHYECWDSRGARWFHLVVGPDLVKREGWKQPNTFPVVKKPAPIRHYDWNPKIAKKKAGQKGIRFELSNGEHILFCPVSKGKFDMSNVPEQDRDSHKVEITRPFWMSKYCVSMSQWRDFAPYDHEGLDREIENDFKKQVADKKHPLVVSANHDQPEWTAFCDYLTRRYGASLPKGYVFRLPTEAEYEWALRGADESVHILNVETFSVGTDFCKAGFVELCRNKKLPAYLGIDPNGRVEGVFIGGRSQANALGIFDLDAGAQGMLDVYDADRCSQNGENWNAWGYPVRDIVYSRQLTKDPLHYDGCLSTTWLLRVWRRGRGLVGMDYRLKAHLVIGPDLTLPVREKLLAPYPASDFGGDFLSDMAKVDYIEKPNGYWCTQSRLDSLLNRTNLLSRQYGMGEETRGFECLKQDAPFIVIKLEEPCQISGVMIDNLSVEGRARNLYLQVSDDGQTFTPVWSDFRALRRYRIDLEKRNIKARYLRIGREPGRVDWFSLHKILIYGKKLGGR